MLTRSTLWLCSLIFTLCSFCQDGAQMKFNSTRHNFGFVRQGDVLEYDYEFTNNGQQPLLVSDTKTECACTTAEKPAKPILPGESGKIHMRFDSKSAIDRQERTIIVSSNAKNSPVTLTFKCIVLKKK